MYKETEEYKTLNESYETNKSKLIDMNCNAQDYSDIEKWKIMKDYNKSVYERGVYIEKHAPLLMKKYY